MPFETVSVAAVLGGFLLFAFILLLMDSQSSFYPSQPANPTRNRHYRRTTARPIERLRHGPLRGGSCTPRRKRTAPPPQHDGQDGGQSSTG